MMSICTDKERWNSTVPACQIMTCLSQYVNFSLSDFDYDNPVNLGTTITHTCLEGYRFDSFEVQMQTTCVWKDLWNISVPDCQTIVCSDLGSLENGIVSVDTQFIDSIVNFTCEEGFELNGSSFTTCLSNGKWSETKPVCNIPQCTVGNVAYASTGLPDNARINYNRTVTYQCHEYYEFPNNIGTETEARCLGKEQWDVMIPDCQILTCSISNVKYSSSGFNDGDKVHFGTTVSYKCQEGYHFDYYSAVHIETTCIGKDVWNISVPDCQIMTCSIPDMPNLSSDGNFSSSLEYSKELTLNCKEGYEFPTGGSRLNLTCVGQEIWNDTVPPYCQKKQCTVHSVANASSGYEPGHQVESGTVVTYQCHTGFEFPDDAGKQMMSICTNKESWNSTVPACQIVTCSVQNVKFSSSGFDDGGKVNFGTTVTHTCQDGYHFDSTAEYIQTTCAEKDLWSISVPDCQSIAAALEMSKYVLIALSVMLTLIN